MLFFYHFWTFAEGHNRREPWLRLKAHFHLGLVLYDEQVGFFRRMGEVAGNKVEIMELQNAPHDTFLAGQVPGFAKEAEDATLIARDFVERQKL